jgi:formiminotetrahydrofolate cyclodeaminase
MRIKDQKIEEFLGSLASKSPTPGGGAAAALAGAMAAGLVEMVCSLTKTNSVQKIAERAKELRIRILELSDEDCAAFDAVIAAYRTKDKAKIKKALQKAVEVPTETKRLSLEVGKLAKEVARMGNKNVYSDAMSAVYLARAAANSAEENIKINQKAIARLG